MTGWDRVDFLIAAVPAPREDRSGAYLADTLVENPGTAVAVMLPGPDEVTDEAPETAIRFLKPLYRCQPDEGLVRTAAIAASY